MFRVDYVFLSDVIHMISAMNGGKIPHVSHNAESKVNDWKFRSGKMYASQKSFERYVETPNKTLTYEYMGVEVERRVYKAMPDSNGGFSWKRIS